MTYSPKFEISQASASGNNPNRGEPLSEGKANPADVFLEHQARIDHAYDKQVERIEKHRHGAKGEGRSPSTNVQEFKINSEEQRFLKNIQQARYAAIEKQRLEMAEKLATTPKPTDDMQAQMLISLVKRMSPEKRLELADLLGVAQDSAVDKELSSLD